MKQLLIFIIIINLSACGYLYNHNQGETYIRIVDSNGKPKKIKTFTPKLNAQYLSDQKRKKYVKEQDYKNNSKTLNSNIIKQKISPTNNVENNLTNKNLSNNFKLPVKSQEKQKNSKKKEFKESEIIYNLSNNIGKKNPVKKEKLNKKVKRNNLLIQVASFSNKRKAIIAQKEKNLANSKILSVKIGKKTYHKLVIGPFENKKDGDQKLKRLKKAGYIDAFYYRFQ